MGFGLGIVVDLVVFSEWVECLVKGVFVLFICWFDLIEMMCFDSYDGLIWFDVYLV